MSTVDKEANVIVSVCANCGKEGDNLKSCAACKLVKYCSRDCQQAQLGHSIKKNAAENVQQNYMMKSYSSNLHQGMEIAQYVSYRCQH